MDVPFRRQLLRLLIAGLCDIDITVLLDGRLFRHVGQIWVRVVLIGQRLFSCAAAGQKLALLAVAPLHSPVLEPDFDLERKVGKVRVYKL